MNKVNVEIAINIMQRVIDRKSAFNMSDWQDTDDINLAAQTEKELLDCGTAACFAGWIGVSPEWQDKGGFILDTGVPVILSCGERLYGADAIQEWLNITKKEAHGLCAVYHNKKSCFIPEYTGKRVEEITAEDVMSILNRLLKTGKVGK